MRNEVLKNKILFILFNALFALPLLALGIFGMSFLNIVLYAVGIVVALYGFLAFFPSIVVKIGIFDKFGNEYVATNLFHRLIVLIITIIAAGIIIYLPTFISDAELLLFIFIIISAVAIGLGVMVTYENAKHYISDLTKEIGLFVPMAYILAGAMFILDAAAGVGAWLRIVVMILAFLFHAFRCYLVFTQSDFR